MYSLPNIVDHIRYTVSIGENEHDQLTTVIALDYNFY